MTTVRWRAGLALAFPIVCPASGLAQAVLVPTVVINGPAPPLPPSVIARDANGQVTVRATRLDAPLILDGRLDEAVYASTPPFGDFIQQEPREGEAASDRTDVWVFFDDQHVYISARLWMSNPEDLLADEMRRDGEAIFSNNHNLGVVLDTFYDHRSGYFFNTNAVGGLRDAVLTDENRNVNEDYNLVWDVKSRRFDRGWVTEIAIPFKTLRYPAGAEQVWGFNLLRLDRHTNEFSYLSPIPRSYGGSGIWMLSAAGTMVGIEAPSGGGRFEVKPYALSSVVTDRQQDPPVSNDASAALGFDVKYKITNGLNADFTYNTDFAQVEVDTQQINLTRFSLFFPEKRDFFLETQSNFTFGPNSRPGGGASVGAVPILFFSRRIGLSGGDTVPIAAGGRLTGRLGHYTVGVLAIRTKDSPKASAPATNFSVVRVRRDFLSRSAVGMIAAVRSPSLPGAGSNRVFGVDTNLRLFRDVEATGYYALSQTPNLSGDATSYLGQFRYAGDRYGAEVVHLRVGKDFNPEVGFLPREDFRRNYASVRFSPRPARLRGVRRLSWEASLEDFASSEGVPQTRSAAGTFRINWDSGEQLVATYTQTDDRPQTAFEVAGAPIAPGNYQFGNTVLRFALGSRRPLTGAVSVSRGSFYGGDRSQVSYAGRVPVTSQFMVEPDVTLNWLSFPSGDFSAQLFGAKTSYAMSPRMVLAAFLQFNSTAHGLGTNVRFHWEYQPGSDFYAVYSDGRDTALGRGFPTFLNRGLTIKFAHLLRM
jgi:hypothetical protein